MSTVKVKRTTLTQIFGLSCGLLLTLSLFVSRAAGQYFEKSYAVFIGVNTAPSSGMKAISYAEGDAKAVGDLLEHQDFQVTRLFGTNATKFNITSTLTNLARQLTSDDRVLVYFVGHGYSEKFDEQWFGYLVPYDGVKNSVTYLSHSEIRDFSAKMGKARHQLFIFDAGFAGLILSTRSGGSETECPDFVKQAAQRPARQVIAAGGGAQQVLDIGPNGHSVFTNALLEAIEQGSANTHGDGVIPLSDLMSYLLRRASNNFSVPVTGVLPRHGGGEFMFASSRSI